MQLPNELWYIIFKLRTKMILKDRHDYWLLKHKDFNEQIYEDIKLLYYTNYENFPYNNGVPYINRSLSATIRNIWSRNTTAYDYDFSSRLDLVWTKHYMFGMVLAWYNGFSYWNVSDNKGQIILMHMTDREDDIINKN